MTTETSLQYITNTVMFRFVLLNLFINENLLFSVELLGNTLTVGHKRRSLSNVLLVSGCQLRDFNPVVHPGCNG